MPGPRCNFCMLGDIRRLGEILRQTVTIHDRPLRDLIDNGGITDDLQRSYTIADLASGIEIRLNDIPVAWMARQPERCHCDDAAAFIEAVISGDLFADLVAMLLRDVADTGRMAEQVRAAKEGE